METQVHVRSLRRSSAAALSVGLLVSACDDHASAPDARAEPQLRGREAGAGDDEGHGEEQDGGTREDYLMQIGRIACDESARMGFTPSDADARHDCDTWTFRGYLHDGRGIPLDVDKVGVRVLGCAEPIACSILDSGASFSCSLVTSVPFSGLDRVEMEALFELVIQRGDATYTRRGGGKCFSLSKPVVDNVEASDLPECPSPEEVSVEGRLLGSDGGLPAAGGDDGLRVTLWPKLLSNGTFSPPRHAPVPSVRCELSADRYSCANTGHRFAYPHLLVASLGEPTPSSGNILFMRELTVDVTDCKLAKQTLDIDLSADAGLDAATAFFIR